MVSTPIQFTDLTVGYDSNVVLHDISAAIVSGSCVAITGANGSGKSTLIKALLGLAPILSGSVELFDRPTTGSIPWQRIGYVPQRSSQGGGVGATVMEVVLTGLLGPRTWWLPRGSTHKAHEALDYVGLRHRAKDSFSVLSGGQQQRVLIARALIRRPDVLFLDEPLTGLDAHNRETLAEAVGHIKETGKTSMIVLHELGELAPLIDREIRIESGHIAHDGPCTHRFHDFSPHHEFDLEQGVPSA